MKERLQGIYSAPLFARMLTVISAVVLLYSCFMISNYLLASVENKKTYEKMQDTFYQNNGELLPISKLDSIPKLNVVQVEPVPKEILSKFAPLIEENDDTVGWIRIPNTAIDYPVVQGADNDFYLNHIFSKKKNSTGTLFMDYRNSKDQLDQNTIIYGHNMKNGSMFKDLTKFRNKDFLIKNKIITFDSIYEKMEWEIFAVFITDAKFDYIQPNFPTEEEFRKYLKTVKDKSLFPIDNGITLEDTILTLSTCEYDFDDARLVVLARLIKIG